MECIKVGKGIIEQIESITEPTSDNWQDVVIDWLNKMSERQNKEAEERRKRKEWCDYVLSGLNNPSRAMILYCLYVTEGMCINSNNYEDLINGLTDEERKLIK